MLGKLLKHEFKATYKVFLGAYAFVAILGIMSLIFNELYNNTPNNAVFSVFKLTTNMVLIMAIVIIFIGTVLMYILRFRSNILKDEGYLMHTLPVKARNLVITKVMATISWLVVDVIVGYFVYSISKLDFLWITPIIDGFSAEMNNNSMIIVLFATYLFVDIILVISQIFASLCIGYTASENRDLMSFVAYIGTYMIIQVTNLIGLVIVSLMNFGKLTVIIESEEFPIDFVNDMFLIMSIILVVLVIAYNTVSIKLLNNKLNLE